MLVKCKGEISSLTRRSLDLDGDPPTATNKASFSKRRRQDTQVLHPELVRQLKEWVDTKESLARDKPLFPISGRVPGITDHRTYVMTRRSLEAARTRWNERAVSASDRQTRENSDFLAYRNHAGLYADFHSYRNLFITSLERVGVRPTVAQKLARHSDIRLTLRVYTFAEPADQKAVIEAMAGPPEEATGSSENEEPSIEACSRLILTVDNLGSRSSLKRLEVEPTE